MYLTHPVRRMRENPAEGEEVVLVVSVESGEVSEDDEARIESAGGTVTDRLQFGAVRVEIPQERIEALCEVPGIESIETEHAVGIGGDAGEDI